MATAYVEPTELGDSLPDRLVIWGASGHALSAIDIVRLTSQFEVVRLIDDIEPDREGDCSSGLPILVGRDKLPGLLAEGVNQLLLAFGHNGGRLEIAELVTALGFSLVTIVHVRAVIAESAMIGPGTCVGALAAVAPLALICASAIVHMAFVVEHECAVEDRASLGPGVRMGGGSRVGYGAQVGIGATLHDHISIGAGSVIGAGAVVVTDIPTGVMAYGVPARIIKEVTSND